MVLFPSAPGVIGDFLEERKGVRCTLDEPLSLGSPGSKGETTGGPGWALEKGFGRMGAGKGCTFGVRKNMPSLSSILGSQQMSETEIARNSVLFRKSCYLEIRQLFRNMEVSVERIC